MAQRARPASRDDGTRFRGPGVHAVAGIGNPQRFFAMLRAQGLTPAEHPFDDHHAFTRKDLDYPGATAILMTQKDAVKCASFADERFLVPAHPRRRGPVARRLRGAEDPWIPSCLSFSSAP
jgi:tetraacyldisaccharide-1-P 4'-kinase